MPTYTLSPGPCCLAGDSPHSFRLDGRHWPSVAHYLLAQEFAVAPLDSKTVAPLDGETGMTLADQIRACRSFSEACACVGASGARQRCDWDAVRQSLARRAVRAKFRAHPALQAVLLSTGSLPLIDAQGAERGDGSGGFIQENHVGFALMNLRAQLRRQATLAARRAAADPTAETTNSETTNSDE